MSSEFEVLDTLKFKNERIFLKEFHVARTFEACRLINPRISQKKILQVYNFIESETEKNLKNSKTFRLIFTDIEKIKYQVEAVDLQPLPPVPRLKVVTQIRQSSGIGKQNYKWTNRKFWNSAQALNLDCDDVIGVNEKDELTETSRFNLFLYDRKQDIVFTPPLESGCVNGAYRRFVIQQGKIMLPNLGEKRVQSLRCCYQELVQYQVYVANSVREVLLARIDE